MKTKESNIQKEIRLNGLTLFTHYYNYVDPESDAGLFRRLQEQQKEKKQPEINYK